MNYKKQDISFIRKQDISFKGAYIMARGLNRRFLRAGRRLSLVQLILIAIILYFLLRILLPLVWTFILVLALIILLKIVLENL